MSNKQKEQMPVQETLAKFSLRLKSKTVIRESTEGGAYSFSDLLEFSAIWTLSEKLLIGRKEAQKAQEELEKNHFLA